MRDLLFELLTHFFYQFLHNKSNSDFFVETVHKILDSMEKISEDFESDDDPDPEIRHFLAHPSKDATRVFTPEECTKLDSQCRSFLLKLEQFELLSTENREYIIQQLMDSKLRQVELNELKETVISVLTQDSDFKQQVWLKDLVLTGDHKRSIH